MMDPLELLRREHHTLQRFLSDLDEMTYSVSVNVRDLSFSFKEFLSFLEKHEEKEKLLLEILSREGIDVGSEPLEMNYGDLKEKSDEVISALDGGDEREIKRLLRGTCGELIDRVKAHVYAEEEMFEKVPWKKLDKKVKEKIGLLHIIPSRKLLRG